MSDDISHFGRIALNLEDGNGWTYFAHIQLDDDWRCEYDLPCSISPWDARASLVPVNGFEMFADSAAECTNVPALIDDYGATVDDIIVMTIDGEEAVFVRSEVVQ